MRNVFLFIRRYFNLLFFLAVQICALTILFRFNKFHESIFSVHANEVTGRINARYSSVENYFTLKKENEALRQQNADLLNRLRENFAWPDSSQQLVSDTFRIDSLEQYRKFVYLPARIISNSVSSQQNFIMLHRGAEQGVATNMGVVGPEGVIGTVVNVSQNMAVVMSLLHRQSKLIAVMKGGKDIGEVSWDGSDPRFVQLTKIPKSTRVNKGDTVLTSSYSDRYPPGYVVGYVDSVMDDRVTSTYNLKLRTATNFYGVQHAFVVRNLQRGEMEALEKSIKRSE